MVIPDAVRTILDLLLIMLGFGAIVFVHELGHFLAARWAGIRVLAFSIGFGPSLLSYRKGMGLRRGSTEPAYLDLVERAQGMAGAERDAARQKLSGEVSPTEYRLSVLPLGGYVKMLGQEDLNPGATSGSPDSYQNRPVWKRMVVISAGVIANMITAAILFVVVFTVGLEIEPARIGVVAPGSPAASAELVSGETPGEARGLRAGDRVVSIDGDTAHDFSDIAVGAAMSKPNSAIEVVVEREGAEGPLTYRVLPERDEGTGLLTIGVGPAASMRVYEPTRRGAWQRLKDEFEAADLAGLEPGMTLVGANGDTSLDSPLDLLPLVRSSGGAPIELEFSSDTSETVRIDVETSPELMTAQLAGTGKTVLAYRHLLGLTGVLCVAERGEPQQGLQHGDVFARLGELEYPSLARGIEYIRASRGQTLDAVVLRDDPEGGRRAVELRLEVKRNGTIGFPPSTTRGMSALLSMPEAVLRDDEGGSRPNPAAGVITAGGTRIVAVDGREVSDFRSLRAALLESTAGMEMPETTVMLTLKPPSSAGSEEESPPWIERAWTLAAADVDALHALRWELDSPVLGVFDNERVVDRAEDPIAAITRGLGKTKRVMQQTYLTIARLFQGGVRVEHLRGPVGIAHMGTSIAERGIIWILFFMALISVNLAVLNFLPLPIVDGGQFLMLAYEGVRGRPVPIPVQNIVTLAGLLLIGSVFLVVTYNDIARLVGG